MAQATLTTLKAAGLDHIVFHVCDAERSKQFYMRLFGMEIDHEGPGPALVEERRRRRAEVLEPPRVRAAHRSGEGRHAKEISAVRRTRHGPGRDPEERGVGFREDPHERNRGVLWVQGEIAKAPLQQRADDTPP